jgi:16S rRNA (guanine1207-N2)-methyltransferase
VTIRDKNNSPKLADGAISISMLADPARGGQRDVLLGGRLEVVSWKGVTPSDRLLIEAAAQTPGLRVVAAMTPSVLPALVLAKTRAQVAVGYYHIDVFHMTSARNLLARHDAERAVALACEPVMPAAAPAPDLALASLRADDEAGLSLELLHQIYHRLAMGGRLLVAINNPRDAWLADKLQKIFGNLTRLGRDKRAMLYSVKKKDSKAPRARMSEENAGNAEKTEAAENAENVSAIPSDEQYIMRVEVPVGEADGEGDGVTLAFDACYGVFSSHKLDDGSGALLRALKPPKPCRAILDLGCGWGGLGIVAARRAGAERLLMIDANARAVQMARRNAARHLAPSVAVDVRLEANVECLDEDPALAGAFDLVVGNPPYGTEFRVSELFLNAAHKALRPGGRAYLVAKNNERLLARAEELFGAAQDERRWGYQVVSATR